MSTGDGRDDPDAILQRAAEQAIELRATIDDLSDTGLRDLIDAVLFEIGVRLAERTRRPFA